MGGKVGGIGAALLGKLGWKEGSGLGARNDGRTEPIRPGRSRERQTQGLGRTKKNDDDWWKKLMAEAYGGGAEEEGPKKDKRSGKDKRDVDVFEACEGRRCRPHGTAKLARLEAQERRHKQKSGKPVAVDSDGGVGASAGVPNSEGDRSDSDSSESVTDGDVENDESDETDDKRDEEHVDEESKENSEKKKKKKKEKRKQLKDSLMKINKAIEKKGKGSGMEKKLKKAKKAKKAKKK